ncbi:hypothetical protein LAA29_120088 [Leuconostoc carnosum]|nr:hypothetical protein LCAC16_150029 [Leuconostoc carnosum]SPO33213.1 hypothetical protein LAA29_120088 [Leuconostoc carnosum]
MLSNYNHEKLNPALTTILQQQAEYSLNSKKPWLSCHLYSQHLLHYNY